MWDYCADPTCTSNKNISGKYIFLYDDDIVTENPNDHWTSGNGFDKSSVGHHWIKAKLDELLGTTTSTTITKPIAISWSPWFSELDDKLHQSIELFSTTSSSSINAHHFQNRVSRDKCQGACETQKTTDKHGRLCWGRIPLQSKNKHGKCYQGKLR